MPALVGFRASSVAPALLRWVHLIGGTTIVMTRPGWRAVISRLLLANERWQTVGPHHAGRGAYDFRLEVEMPQLASKICGLLNLDPVTCSERVHHLPTD